MRVLIAIGALGLLIHGSPPAFPRAADASAALANARPGHVRHASGDPVVLGAGRPQSEPLQAGRRLKSGEQIYSRTGDRVEIVLSANSYLRIGGRARVNVLSADYPAMDFRLVEGDVDKCEWATLDSWGMERSAFLLNCFWGRRPLVSVPAVTQPIRANAGYQIKAGGGLRTAGNSRAELLLSPLIRTPSPTPWLRRSGSAGRRPRP